ncbi:PH domain-containing protein [Rossellomorea arthrocnemi]
MTNTLKEKLVTARVIDQGESIISYIKCSMDVFIYRQVLRPGVLVLTNEKLVFIADSIPGNELTQKFEKDKITSIKIEKGLLNKKIVIRYENDVYKFKNILSENIEAFVNLVKDN